MAGGATKTHILFNCTLFVFLYMYRALPTYTGISAYIHSVLLFDLSFVS